MFQLFHFTVLLSILKCWQLYLVLTIYIDKGIRRIISFRGISIPQLSTWGTFFSPPLVLKLYSQKFWRVRFLALFGSCLLFFPSFIFFFFFVFYLFYFLFLFFLLLYSKPQLESNLKVGQWGYPEDPFSGHQTSVVNLWKLIRIVSLSKQHILNMNFVKEIPLFSRLLNSKLVPFTVS